MSADPTPAGGDAEGAAGAVDEAKWDAMEAKEKELGLFFGQVHDRNLKSFKLLNSVCLPVRYSEQFYQDLLKTPDELTKMVYFRDVFVGGIGCRVEPVEGSSDTRIYIMTLGVLAPYRGLGIGSCLVHSVLKASRDAKFSDCKDIYLHVHTANDAAIKFYRRFGFIIKTTIKNYYKRVDPPDCYVLSRPLGPDTFPSASTEE